jgi:hypothetical protein
VASDQRLLIVQGHKNGDMSLTVPYDNITSVEMQSMGHTSGLEITMVNGDMEMSPAAMLEEHEVRPFVEYIHEISDIKDDKKSDAKETSDEKSNQDTRRYIAEKHGTFVTEKQVGKMQDVLDDDEQVHYLTSGSTVDVEGSSAGESLFGDDRSRKSGTKGWVRTGITDKRVVVKVPQWLGDDERSIPYQNITSVDLDTGLAFKRLTLQTPGQTYHIEATEPDKDEIREAMKFIRNKMTESTEEKVVVQSNDEPDPTEQLQNLKELYNDGVLTDEEFEEKSSQS